MSEISSVPVAGQCDAIIEGLKRHYLFAAMGDDALDRIVANGRLVRLEDGQVLFRKGDPGDFFYCIIEGRVHISYEDDGKVHVLNDLAAGSVFGETAVLDRQPRSADASANGPVLLFAVPRDDFRQVLIAECQLEDRLVQLLCERMRWVSDQVERKNRVERELRKLTLAVEHSPAVVIIMDAAGKVEYVNPKFTAVTGWSLDDVAGQVPAILQIDAASPELHTELWATLHSGQEWRGDLQSCRKDGGTYWESCSISPVFDNGVISNFVAVMEDITERKRLQDELHRLATTDFLTGVANRRHFMERAQAEIGRATRFGKTLSIIMMDVDHFKKVNDVHGHAAGDATLVALSAAAKAMMRDADVFGRLGGEEFAVILPETDLSAAARVAERMREHLSQVEIPLDEGVLKVTVSLGVAQLGPQEKSIDPAIGRADAGLYRAKGRGRNRVEAVEG